MLALRLLKLMAGQPMRMHIRQPVHFSLSTGRGVRSGDDRAQADGR